VTLSPVQRFLLWAFGLDWTLALGFWLAGGKLAGAAGMIVGMAYMTGPAIAAVIVQRRSPEPLAAALGLHWRWNRWFVLAWLLPPVLAIAAMGVALLLPGVTFSTEMAGMYDRFKDMLTPEQVLDMKRQMATLPVHPFWLTVAQGLIAGISVNAVFALGEELGWRGFLQKELAHLGFWSSSGLIGAIWGVWHAPFILMGHNYPQHPVVGVVMMTLFCLGWAPLLAHISANAGSVLAAALTHGSLNGTVGLAILLVNGGNDLLVGITGLAGLFVLAAANAVLWIVRRP
jgi:membrane protease YdiL (CAAX protease family)